MPYRARTECWFGRLYRAGEEAEFPPGTRVPAALFLPLSPDPADPAVPAAGPARMAALRRQARARGVAPRRAWTAADLEAAIAAAASAAGEAGHGQ